MMTNQVERIYQKVHGASIAVDRAMKQCVCHQPMMAHSLLHLAKLCLAEAMEIAHETDKDNSTSFSDKGQRNSKLGNDS